MVQGDAYNLDVTIDVDNEPIDISTVEQVEIVLLTLSKMYPDEMTYSDGVFHFPLSQTETFNLPKCCPMQVRVKFNGSSNVIGAEKQVVNVHEALSRRVL